MPTTKYQKHLRARLAHALLELKDIYGTLSDGAIINCSFKRADLAGLSNMNIANVIRTLSAFSKEGITFLEKKRVKLIELNKLREISNRESSLPAHILPSS